MRLAVADENVDVKTAKPKDMQLDSDLFALKIYMHGQVTTTASGEDIVHNLGFQPLFLVYTYDITNKRWQLSNSQNNYSTTAALRIGEIAGTKCSYFIFADNIKGDKSSLTKKEGYQVLVSKKGKDVLRGEPTEMSFDSNYPSLKIYKSGVISTSSTATISHDLKYAPAIYVLVDNWVDPSVKYYLTCPAETLLGNFYAYSYTDRVEFSVDDAASHIFKYFIFRDEL